MVPGHLRHNRKVSLSARNMRDQELISIILAGSANGYFDRAYLYDKAAVQFLANGKILWVFCCRTIGANTRPTSLNYEILTIGI